MTPASDNPIIRDDPWLAPYSEHLQSRAKRYQHLLRVLDDHHGSLLNFAGAHHFLGINYDQENQGWWYREWAPEAYALYLTGDFNNWNRLSHPLTKTNDGIWEIFLPEKEYKEQFTHKSKIKVHVIAKNGTLDRIPAYIRRVIQDESTKDFAGQVWDPPQPYQWEMSKPDLARIKNNPLIYEAHVGMAQEKNGVGTYLEFAENVIPHIARTGYNVIQLMAVQEHPYYGSFGYHVSNYFCPSSRFGTPEELKYLVDQAHKHGLAIIMDMVHSHSVKNRAEGLNEFDGSGYQYFHEGGRGYHELWDSKLFNYGKTEVIQFLLSNVRYWLEEFNFDGFRFDGVTSMLYHHHGQDVTFDHYDKYFVDQVDNEAITYLQLANHLSHQIEPHTMNIAEDNSGLPGLCRSQDYGGIGFDFRLGMGIPDFWIKLLKEKNDEDWSMGALWNELINRRRNEKTIAYAESHDQAIVGDKTIAFRLMDKEMYYHMSVNDENYIIDRGLALHKMIRLITCSLGGEGYLNFIGNEFAHPEWVDFPREGNNWSHHYARRQWSLLYNDQLKYKFFYRFDQDMVALVKKYGLFQETNIRDLNQDENNNVIVFQRGSLVFAFNFHPDRSITDYRFFITQPGSYKIILNSDTSYYGGFDRVDMNMSYPTIPEGHYQHLSIYLPQRTALVLVKE